MFNLITRFHLLLVLVLGAMTAVAVFRVPADYAYAAHWVGGQADWLWPRNMALTFGPVIAGVVLIVFALLGRALTKNHLAKVTHILQPAITLLLGVLVAVQLGLLLTGIGSDLDMVRLTAIGLGLLLIVLGVVFAEAERHTYAGLRLPWPIASDRRWRRMHRIAGAALGLAGAGLLGLAWLMPDLGPLVIGFAAALLVPPLLVAGATLTSRG